MSGRPMFSIDPFQDPPLAPVEPADGWKEPCQLADHKWTLVIEDGQVRLECVDPHPESFINEIRPDRRYPACLDHYWQAEDLYCDGIPVKVTHIDDSTPSTPNGPAEYGFYITVEPFGSGGDVA